MRNLTKIKATGKVQILSVSVFESENLKIDLDAGSSLEVELFSYNNECSISGDGKVLISGVVDNLNVQIQNNAKVELAAYVEDLNCMKKGEGLLLFDAKQDQSIAEFKK